MPRSPRRERRRRSGSSSSSSSNDRRSRTDRKRQRSRDRTRGRERSRSPVPARPIASDLPKYLNARVFVGRLKSDQITTEELEKHFMPYGTILDCSVHPKGFGFVQFLKEDDAKTAVIKETGTLMKGSRIDIKMAAEGRRDRTRERRRTPPPFDSANYPPREREGRDPPARGPPAARDRSPVRDPYERDPYRDPYRDPARPLPPRGTRDPYYDDPYRRPPPPDPYFDRYRDDPYRRDPYADPYRDPYRDPYYDVPAKRPPPPTECSIILMNASLRTYAESIERKVKALNVIAEVVVIPEEKTLAQQVEEVSRLGSLFAVVLNSQNEAHLSLTLNILHGSPQEHRNMPVDDAVALIGRSFEKYLQSMKEKAAAVAAPAVTAAPAPAVAAPAGRQAPFLPPSKEVSYLLNLLADNRQLTLEELDKIIMYLRDRRDKMIETDRARPIAAGDVGYADEQRVSDGRLQQQELQSKILSIFNGQGQSSSGMVAPPPPIVPPAASAPGVNAALINFDNPSVQKALDNLIQSGPNLLRNINVASSSPATASTASVARESGRPGLLSTPPGVPQRASYPGQGAAAGPAQMTMRNLQARSRY